MIGYTVMSRYHDGYQEYTGMDLYNFHRVLICSAIVFFAGFGAYSWHRYSGLGQGSYLAVALGSGIIGVAMLGYLFYFNISLRRLQNENSATEVNAS